jgi:hypothetical protein
VLCERCKKRDSIAVVGGRKLCVLCARDEIIKRIKREFYPNKVLVYREHILFAYPIYLSQISDLLKMILLDKIYKKFSLSYSELPIDPTNSIIDDIWSIIIKSKIFSKQNNINKVILPFTADFLMAYLIYSISKGDYTYINLLDFEYKLDNILFLIPFYNTSIIELQGFINANELNLITKDELFNTIIKWETELLKDNYELFHAFHNSKKLFQEKNYKCEGCGGLINSPVKYCGRCSVAFASHPY